MPIVEPEVLMDGDHSIAMCEWVTEKTLDRTFEELKTQRVDLEGMVLKPNMVLSGTDAEDRAEAEEVAQATVGCFKRTIPAAYRASHSYQEGRGRRGDGQPRCHQQARTIGRRSLGANILVWARVASHTPQHMGWRSQQRASRAEGIHRTLDRNCSGARRRVRLVVRDEISRLVAERSDEIVATRRYLHAIPETGFQERKTAAYIAKRLDQAGLDVHEGLGETGIVANLEGGKPGRTLAIRADIDALPIDELTGLEFASTNGNMHACGHDGHITMALTAAEILAANRDRISGNVSFIFQPSEEIAQGALAMIADGAMEIANADVVIGTHLWNQMPMGYVGVNQSTVFAAADMFKMTVRGHGGHGAMPHLTVDPVVAAANIINACQTVVAREILLKLWEL